MTAASSKSAAKPPRPLTAVERTLSMFAGGTHGEPQDSHATPIVAVDGPTVRVVALRLNDGLAAKHLTATYGTLCGLRFAAVDVERDPTGLGTSQACRAAASKLRARLGR